MRRRDGGNQHRRPETDPTDREPVQQSHASKPGKRGRQPQYELASSEGMLPKPICASPKRWKSPRPLERKVVRPRRAPCLLVR